MTLLRQGNRLFIINVCTCTERKNILDDVIIIKIPVLLIIITVVVVCCWYCCCCTRLTMLYKTFFLRMLFTCVVFFFSICISIVSHNTIFAIILDWTVNVVVQSLISQVVVLMCLLFLILVLLYFCNGGIREMYLIMSVTDHMFPFLFVPNSVDEVIHLLWEAE